MKIAKGIRDAVEKWICSHNSIDNAHFVTQENVSDLKKDYLKNIHSIL